MSIAFDRVEFGVNPEPRCPCALVLDTSGSMNGSPIAELNAGLHSFQVALASDTLAAQRVEIALITFPPARKLQDFITAGQFSPPTLRADGDTPMGSAINLALDALEERKQIYKMNGIAYYRPWVLLITDGEPTDGDAWRLAAQRVHEIEERKKAAFFAIGVENANMGILEHIARRKPLKLKGLQFHDMFVWLSSSLASVSRSSVGDTVPLQSPLGWSTV